VWPSLVTSTTRHASSRMSEWQSPTHSGITAVSSCSQLFVRVRSQLPKLVAGGLHSSRLPSHGLSEVCGVLCARQQPCSIVPSHKLAVVVRVGSIMDYPGFQSAEPPDFETFSKSINGGQYPLSVLALGPRVPEIYVQGLYGNTMTTNPRALSVACSVLGEFSPELRKNIQDSGLYFKQELVKLGERHPDAITDVTGTGLLIAAHLNPEWRVLGGENSVERLCRKDGLNVIHGGANALRFTPWYNLSETEVRLQWCISGCRCCIV